MSTQSYTTPLLFDPASSHMRTHVWLKDQVFNKSASNHPHIHVQLLFCQHFHLFQLFYFYIFHFSVFPFFFFFSFLFFFFFFLFFVFSSYVYLFSSFFSIFILSVFPCVFFFFFFFQFSIFFIFFNFFNFSVFFIFIFSENFFFRFFFFFFFPSRCAQNIAFSCNNLNFKARFWVREERKKRERRKKNAPTETGPLPQSHAQELIVIRVRGTPLTPTKVNK